MKKCSKCKDFKDESEFGKDKNRKDKLYPQCKACRKIYTDSHKKEARARYQERKKELKEYNKIYFRTKKGKEVRRKYQLSQKGKEAHRKGAKIYKRNHPEKKRAHQILNYAIKSGKIIKPESCSKCGEENEAIHGHHISYAKGRELDVIWFCKRCHIDLHKSLKKVY